MMIVMMAGNVLKDVIIVDSELFRILRFLQKCNEMIKIFVTV